MKILVTIFLFTLLMISAKGQSANEMLYHAVATKDTLQVEKLLKNGGDANYKKRVDGFESSLLILSIQNKDFKTVKLLIDHKAEINFKDWFKSTPIMYAAYEGNLQIIDYLLKNGADIHSKDDQGNTVLSSAREGNHPDAIKFIENRLKE